MHPRLRIFKDIAELTDQLAARIAQDANKPLTRGETIGVIALLIFVVCGMLYLALTR